MLQYSKKKENKTIKNTGKFHEILQNVIKATKVYPICVGEISNRPFFEEIA